MKIIPQLFFRPHFKYKLSDNIALLICLLCFLLASPIQAALAVNAPVPRPLEQHQKVQKTKTDKQKKILKRKIRKKKKRRDINRGLLILLITILISFAISLFFSFIGVLLLTLAFGSSTEASIALLIIGGLLILSIWGIIAAFKRLKIGKKGKKWGL